MGHLPDGRIQLFAVDTSGGMWTMWKLTTDPNAGWTQWQSFQVPGTAYGQASSGGGQTYSGLQQTAMNTNYFPPIPVGVRTTYNGIGNVGLGNVPSDPIFPTDPVKSASSSQTSSSGMALVHSG
jgi:hypothetical protein